MGLFDFLFGKKPEPARKPLTKEELRALSETIRKTPARKVPAPTVPPRRATGVPLSPRRTTETRRDESASMLDPLNPLSPLSPISPLNPIYHDTTPSYTPAPSCDPSPSYDSGSW
jgi:hypothetical protein